VVGVEPTARDIAEMDRHSLPYPAIHATGERKERVREPMDLSQDDMVAFPQGPAETAASLAVGDPHLAAGCVVHEEADQVEAVLTAILRDV
jgi:hypothetical protein